MKYYIITDSQGYILTIQHTNTVKDYVELNLDDYDLSNDRIYAYELGKNELLFDPKRYEEIQAEKQKVLNNKEIAELQKKLQETDYIILKWGEEIISLDNALTWVADVIKINLKFIKEYKGVLKNRKLWRERIEELRR